MARPTKQWYRSMNKIYVDEQLERYPKLLEKYGLKYSSFRNFCYLVMDKFGWQDMESIQNEFDAGEFYGLNFLRMNQTNVKQWQLISKTVFKRDGYKCTYRGQIGGILEVDHIIPFSKGGAVR